MPNNYLDSAIGKISYDRINSPDKTKSTIVIRYFVHDYLPLLIFLIFLESFLISSDLSLYSFFYISKLFLGKI